MEDGETNEMSRAQICKMAHALNASKRLGLSYCLRMAWQFAKGNQFVSVTTYMDGSRSLIFGNSYDEVRAARIAAVNASVARGIKPIGSNESNLAPYLPAHVNAPKPSKPARTNLVRPVADEAARVSA